VRKQVLVGLRITAGGKMNFKSEIPLADIYAAARGKKLESDKRKIGF
jgi:hypothetical protein